MAPSATNGDTMIALEEIKSPDGVVLPPREIKSKKPYPLPLLHCSGFANILFLKQYLRKLQDMYHEMDLSLRVKISSGFYSLVNLCRAYPRKRKAQSKIFFPQPK